ncbi:TPA: restriction endonuclease subunit S [Streptococcus suis]
MSFNEWHRVRIKDVFELIPGFAFKSKDFSENGIPVIKIKNVKELRLLDRDFSYIDPKYLETKSRFTTKKGDLLISMTGNRIEGSMSSWVGKVCRINSDKKYLINQRVGILRLSNESYSDKFFLYLLASEEIQKKLISIATSSGGQANISPDQIKSLEFSIPCFEEQKAIAHILSTLDDKIEVNNEINKTLENMAQVIFKQWFVDFEFPNEDGEPYKSSGGEMVESELGMIPKGWEVKKVEQVTKIIRGASPRPIQDFIRDEGIPWVKISDASSSNTRFISSTKEFIKEEGRKKSREVKVGTLILSNSATPGIPMIMKIDACVHDGWLIFDEFREVTKEYMFHFLTENRIGILSLSNGSVFRNLKTDILKNYKIIIPSRDVVVRVDNIFKSINNSIDNIENQITTLTKIRDGLLTKLMSGEIRVPLDEEGDVS